MNRKYKRFITLLLAFAIVASVTSATVIAKAVDLGRSCTLFVGINGKNQYPDLADVDLQIDLYEVAPIVPVEGYDNYTYGAPVPEYSGLDFSGNKSKSDWYDLAQEAMRMTFVNNVSPSSMGLAYSTIENLSPGLYLVVAHGPDMSSDEYVRELTDDEGNTRLAGSVIAGTGTYLFSPEFVSMPGRTADENGNVNTANPGEWLYDVRISLKTEPADRFTSLEIVKNLDGFVEGSPATFVFEIEAVYNGANVYSDVVTITLDSAGTSNVIVDDIPVGSEVTVTEIYSGGCYTLISEGTQTTVCERGEVSTVEFTNAPNDKAISGGGITNRFEYRGERWTWTQIPHNS